MPVQEPPSAAQSSSSGGGDAAPTMSPTDAAQSGSTDGVGAWVSDKKLTALWGISQNRNSWVYIQGVGWKKLANNSDTAVVALTMLAAHVKQTATPFSYREEADGMIHEAYVW
jgi:glycine cleavage system protein P-like pyridoxal-binding family